MKNWLYDRLGDFLMPFCIAYSAWEYSWMLLTGMRVKRGARPPYRYRRMLVEWVGSCDSGDDKAAFEFFFGSDLYRRINDKTGRRRMAVYITGRRE